MNFINKTLSLTSVEVAHWIQLKCIVCILVVLIGVTYSIQAGLSRATLEISSVCYSNFPLRTLKSHSTFFEVIFGFLKYG